MFPINSGDLFLTASRLVYFQTTMKQVSKRDECGRTVGPITSLIQGDALSLARCFHSQRPAVHIHHVAGGGGGTLEPCDEDTGPQG